MKSIVRKVSYLSVMLIVAIDVRAASYVVDFDQLHTDKDSNREQHRLEGYKQNVSNWRLTVEEGFFLKDTDLIETWSAVGGSGKFHSSTEQNLDVSKSLLLTSALRINANATNPTLFRLCRVDLALERAINRPVKAIMSYISDESVLIDGENQAVRVRNSQAFDVPLGGSFVELNLSSKPVYEVLVHAEDDRGLPVTLVVDQIVLERGFRTCI